MMAGGHPNTDYNCQNYHNTVNENLYNMWLPESADIRQRNAIHGEDISTMAKETGYQTYKVDTVPPPRQWSSGAPP